MTGDPHGQCQKTLLFISYQASDQKPLADWLSLRLAADGYYVWIDSRELLGGEPFDTTIDKIIRDRTFRMIALVSSSSTSPWAAKERGLAYNLAHERNEPDFIIPLVTDGSTRAQLNFTLSNVALIDFTNWAEGLGRLLDKLEKVGAPGRDPVVAREHVAQSALRIRGFEDGSESIFTNYFPFASVPCYLREYRFSASLSLDERRELSQKWPFYGTAGSAFSFEPAPGDIMDLVSPGPLHSTNQARIGNISTGHILQPLISRHISRRLRALGLVPEDERNLSYIFPYEEYAGRRLPYMLTPTRRSGKQVCGLRNHGRNRYSTRVSCSVRPMLGVNWGMVLRIGLVFLKDDGSRYDPRLEIALRKKMTKSWYNSQWLGLQRVVIAFMAGQQASVNLCHGESEELVLSASPIQSELPFRLIDKKLKQKSEHEEGSEDVSED